MFVDFPTNRTVSRGTFLGLLKKRYPSMKEATLISLLARQIQPIKTPGRYHQFGVDQWQAATHWVESRSRAYQSQAEQEILNRKEV